MRLRRVAILLILLLLPAIPFAQTGTVSKTPFEQIDLSLDFVNRAPNGISLSSVSAINLVSNRDSTASIIVQSPDSPAPAVYPASNKVIVRVKGGSVGEKYNIGIRVVKSDTGEQLEGNITLTIVAAQ